MALRLSDPLIGLSAIADLGRGLEPGHAARTCFIACRLARELDVDDEIIRVVFYTALLQHIGCVAHAHDTAPLDRGRNIEVNAASDRTDFSRPADILNTFLPALTDGGDIATRLRRVLPAIQMAKVVARTSCEVAETTARRIGLPAEVQTAVRHITEWFNGKGGFLRQTSADIPLAARVVLTAFTVSIFDQLGGPDAAFQATKTRSGKMLDPAIVDAFRRTGEGILAELAASDVLSTLADEEPEPKTGVDDDRIDQISVAFGEAVDLKAPFTHGSAGRAFDIVGQAAFDLGLEDGICAEARRSAALRDIGKAALTNALIEKPGRLTEIDREQVRLHAYHTERVLGRSQALRGEAALAGMHHERVDGTGYHRGSSGSSIPMGARVIAAADALVAMTQPRPYRAAFGLDEACGWISSDRGFDPEAVAAVIDAAHGVSHRRRQRVPAELSDRQLEVLRLVAQGLSNRQIAERLVLSSRTAEHHVQDIYLKIGVSSRAAAALFAVEHGLL
jgi:HD-GYP domain-containing protein (c-di-GMP phosphodiesterase class II)